MGAVDLYHPFLAGCTDGSCIIRKPQGMITSGGCQCQRELSRTPVGLQAVRTIEFLRKQLRELHGEQSDAPTQFTGCRDADQALVLLDRLSVPLEDEKRISQLEQLVIQMGCAISAEADSKNGR